MLLKGKNAIVTGCARGIGRAVLECFAAHGANIWACVRTDTTEFRQLCSDLSRQYQITVTPVFFDLEQTDEIKAGIKQITGEKQPIDILVNNAGMVPENRLFQMASIEHMKKVFDVNFFAPMLFTQYITRVMTRQKRGSVVNIASVAALDGGPAQTEYVSSKAAMVGATRKLAIELGQYGVRVNAVAPGLTETDMIKNMNEETLNRTISSTIMKRMAQPAEIANTVLFLASDLSSYITGQVIRVDGGTVR